MALQGVNYCLHLIGFTANNNRQRIRVDGLSTFDDFCNINEYNIGKMAESFAKCTIAEGKIVFGYDRTKKLKGLMH